jgi:Tfp pilus assembly protein PilF
MELISSGQKLLIDENFASAVEVFSKAIDADSESFDAYLGRAVAYHNLNFFDQALADYDRAAGLATSSSSKPAEISTSSLHQLHLFRG